MKKHNILSESNYINEIHYICEACNKTYQSKTWALKHEKMIGDVK